VLRSAAGKLYLQRPGKFRWDYSEPSEQLVLADGKQIWFYDKDLSQANVRDMDATLASTPASLLSGNGAVSSQFDIKALPRAAAWNGFSSYPSIGHGFPVGAHRLRQGRAGVHVPGGQAGSGDAADLHAYLAQRESCADDLFTFTPPAGVDVIGRDAK
jgi:outer membrane lipoprotein carrier protein